MNLYHRIRVMSVVVLAVLSLGAPAAAQDGDTAWSALVYSAATHTLVRVGVDGELASYDLDFDADDALQGRHIAVWPDGERVAYCAVGVDGMSLFVHDLTSGAILSKTSFNGAADCRVTQASLSDDGERLAVALFYYFPGQADADTRTPPWQLAVVDADSGGVVQTLDGDEAVARTDIDADRAIIPEARAFTGDSLTFFAMPYAVGASNRYPVYEWTLHSDALRPVDDPGIYDVALLPETGERAYATQDETLPFALPDGPMPPNNVVRYDDGQGAPYTIYHSPGWVTIDTVFIENGQRLAIIQTPAADQPQTTAFTVAVRAIALDRQGRTTDLLSSNGTLSLLGAPSGAIALFSSTPVEGPYRLLYSLGGQTTPLWQADGASWELVWSAPTMPPPGLPPFPAWTP